MPRKEEHTHKAICEYIKLKYPHVIFLSDGSGLKLPMGLAVKFSKLKSEKAIPDLFVAEPRGSYKGLFLEIKKEGTRVFKRDGTIRKTKNDHFLNQAKMLDRLKHKGYASFFCVGADMGRQIIDDYMAEGA